MSKRKRNNKTKYLKFISSIICLVCILIYGFIMQNTENTNNVTENISQNQNVTFDLSSIPEYSSSPYVKINNLFIYQQICQCLKPWVNRLFARTAAEIKIFTAILTQALAIVTAQNLSRQG